MGTLLGACAGSASAPVSDPPIASVGLRPPLTGAADFATLNGLNAADLRRLLGDPDFRRQEPPAQIWQYRTTECVLDVFLYSDAGGEYHVVHAEIRDRGVVRVSQSSCYGSLVTNRDRLRQSQL